MLFGFVNYLRASEKHGTFVTLDRFFFFHVFLRLKSPKEDRCSFVVSCCFQWFLNVFMFCLVFHTFFQFSSQNIPGKLGNANCLGF